MAASLDIDHCIVYAFLLITLVIGLLAGSGVKDLREYAIGNKRFGTGVLTMTMLATYITGAQGIGYVGYVFEDGILPIFSLLICGNIITYLCIARYIAPTIQHFQDCLTLPEVMGKLYGPRVRWAIGVLGACYSVAIVTLQIIWLGYIGVFFDLPQHLSVFLGGIFLVFYAARGGMKAVAITDVLQFIAILVFVPLVAYIVLYRVGGIKALLSQVPESTWAVLHHPSLQDYVVYCIWDLFPAFPLSFPFMQRMLMAKDKKQLVDSYYVGMSFLSVFYVLLTLIGLSAIVLHQTVDVHMPQKGSNIFVYLVKNYLPVGARGIVCTGLIAGVISTADSFLHSAGVVLAHDVMHPAIKRKVGVLRLARYITFFLGIVALSTAMYYKALPQDLYGSGLDLGKGLNFITEVVALIFTVPLVAGMMGLKTDTRSFLVSSVLTVVMFVLSPYYLTKQWALPIAITTNLLSFFGTHYLRHRRFVVVRQTARQYRGQQLAPTQEHTRGKLASLLPSPPKNPFLYSQKRIARYGSNPNLFALFTAFSYMIPFFMHSYAEPATYNWLLAVRGIGALLCVGLLLQAYWPKSLLPYFPSYYHLSLMYCLPFTTSFIFLLEGSNVEWLINVALTIMFLIVLVDWLSFVILTALGISLGLLFYTLAIGPIALQLDFSTGYLLVYTCIFSTLIALLFARRREQHLEAKLREISDHHHANKPVAADIYPAVCRIVTMIEQQVLEFSNNYRQQSEASIQLTSQGELLTTPDCLLYLFPTALEIIKQGADMDHHLVQEIKQAHIDPQANLLSLKACVTSILENYRILDRQDAAIDTASEDYPTYASFTHLQYALIHVLRFIHACDPDTGVSLKITPTEGIHISLHGKSLPYASIQQLFSLFPAQTSAKHPGLAISRLLIEAHGGQLLCRTHTIGQSLYTEFILLIPPAGLGTREHSSPT